jgi:hypothetical protein
VRLIDVATGTTTCNTASPSPSDISVWKAQELVRPGVDLDYPQTQIDFYSCGIPTTGAAMAMGQYHYDSIVSSLKSSRCASSTATSCGENSWAYDPAQFDAFIDQTIAGCVPRHLDGGTGTTTDAAEGDAGAGAPEDFGSPSDSATTSGSAPASLGTGGCACGVAPRANPGTGWLLVFFGALGLRGRARRHRGRARPD